MIRLTIGYYYLWREPEPTVALYMRCCRIMAITMKSQNHMIDLIKRMKTAHVTCECDVITLFSRDI